MFGFVLVQDIGFIKMTGKRTGKNTRLIMSAACIDGCFGQNNLPSFGAGRCAAGPYTLMLVARGANRVF